MKTKHIIYTTYTVVALLAGCKQAENAHTQTSSTFADPVVTFSEAEYSAWMTKAEVHAEFAKNKAGEYFAYIEGRNNSGLHQYRFVRKQFPATVYTEWAVYWALRPDEFYKVESSTLAKGMERNSLQVFTDATGLSHHQAVWVMKKSGAPK